MSVNPSYSLTQKGTHLSTALLITNKYNSKSPRIIDSGATDHMTDCSNLFSYCSPCAGKRG